MNSLNISDIVHYKSIENDVNTFDFNHGHELTNIGVQPDTIQTFKEIIASSIERTIPIFKYYDSHYNLNGYSYYSETFKKHIRLSKKPSFFYLEPPTRHAIKTVVICPDPIELLSYYQIRSVYNSETLLIAPHPHTKLSSLSWLLYKYPHCNFYSIFPHNNADDILNNLAINLALSGIKYDLDITDSIVYVTYKKRTYTSVLSKINMPFFNKVISKKHRAVKSYNPPKKYYSYNQIINDI